PQRLLRRRRFFRRGFGSRSSSGIDRSRISRRRGDFHRRSRSFLGRCSRFFLGTTGAQHKGNRNGAPNLCIHRQLPQFVQ
ncbi:MAG: hypothetical protein ACREEP_12485, partial [Dongiaceae bacterium]